MLTLAAWVLAQSAQPAQAPELLDYPRVAARLTDLRWMLEEPRPGEALETRQWPDGSGNRGAHFEGPGALTRVWISRPVGELRFFVDGDAEPTFTWPLETFAAGGTPSWMAPPLAERCGAGWHCFIPITFARSLRLEHASDDDGVVVQVAVRRFGAGVTVPSFPADPPGAWRLALRQEARRMAVNAHPEATYEAFMAGPAAHRPLEGGTPLQQGELHFFFRGHGIVRYLQVEFLNDELPAPMEELLRALTVRVEMGVREKKEAGEVQFEVPFAEFFGAAWGGTEHATSWHAGYESTTGRFYNRFPIPYRKGMKIIVASALQKETRMKISYGAESFADPDAVPPLRLHAGWTHGTDAARPDGAALHATGPARLASYVFGATAGHAQPWAWSGPLACFAGMDPRGGGAGFVQVTRRDGPEWFGRSSVQRVFTLDAPQDATELRFAPGVDLGGDEPVDWSAFALWYAPPDADSSFDGFSTWQERRPPDVPSAPFPVVEGAMEGESMRVVDLSLGTSVEVRAAPPPAQGEDHWSRRQYLWWSAGGEGVQQLNLSFPVRESGEYACRVQLAEGPEFGRVQLFLDGVRVGEPIDCSAETLRPGGEITLAVQRMMPRLDHRLGVRSLDGKPVGLDYFLLEAVEEDDAEAGDGEESGQ